MKKIAIFAALCLLAGLDYWTASAQSRTDTIDSVTVTATRVPIALHSSARIVTLLDSVTIASSPVETINDLLKFAPGVDVRQRGAMGMQTDISIRGGTYNQVAVLLDGINITDPQTGHNSFDFPVNICDIERIEVLEGPAARVYGTSSLLGAVNIVTRKAAGSSVAASLEGGSFKFLGATASGEIAYRGGFNSISAGYQRSDGFSRNSAGGLNSDYGAFKAFCHGALDFGQRNISWQAGISNKDFGSSTFYSSSFDDQFEHTLKTFASVKSEGKGKLHFTPSLYWNHGEDRFELFRNAPEKYPFNFHKTDVAGANLNFRIDSRLGQTAFGAEARHERIASTNLGEKLAQPRGVYACGLSRTAFNLFLEHNITVGRLSASAGLTTIYNTGNREGVRLFPGLDANFRISDAVRLYASYNTSYRMPTFTELYYSVGGHLADPDLKAEKLRALEGGLKFLGRGLRAHAAVYYNRGYDLIDWIKDTSDGEDAPWMSVNHTRLNTFGQEVSLRLAFPALLGIPGFFFESLNLGYTHQSQDKQLEGHLRSIYSLEYIRNKVVIQADFRFLDRLSMNLAWRYVDRSTGSDLMVPYSLLDARVSYAFPRLNLYLRANNLLNRTWYDFGDIPQPGLWVMAGISFKLSL
ncbi:MAG: TonB-dependent receptor [Bacteroidales bacterium]|nr:TonB-dependent receptor [Bacteroidales bacterium]